MKLHYSFDLLGAVAWAVYTLGQILFHGLDAPIVERALLALLHYSALDLLVMLALDEKTPATALGAAIVAGAWSLFYFYAGSHLQAATAIPMCAFFASFGITLLKRYAKTHTR